MPVVEIVLSMLLLLTLVISGKSLRAKQWSEGISLIIGVIILFLIVLKFGTIGGTIFFAGIILPWLILNSAGRKGRRIYFIGLGIFLLINCLHIAWLTFFDTGGSAHGGVIFLFVMLIVEVAVFNLVAMLVSASLSKKQGSDKL